MNTYIIKFKDSNFYFNSISECKEKAESLELSEEFAQVYKYRKFNFPNIMHYGDLIREDLGKGFYRWVWKNHYQRNLKS